MIGTKKAKVFPLPVLAAPTRSLPARHSGMDFAWIWVILSNFIFKSASFKQSDIGKALNFSSLKIPFTVLGTVGGISSVVAGASDFTFFFLAEGSATATSSSSISSTCSSTGFFSFLLFFSTLELIAYIYRILAHQQCCVHTSTTSHV